MKAEMVFLLSEIVNAENVDLALDCFTGLDIV